MRLKGKTALITGATSGIGKSIARLFLEEGASVALNYHHEDGKLEKTRSDLHALLSIKNRSLDELLFVKADISSEPEVEAMFRKVVSHFGGLDILVNNAGTEYECPSHLLTEEQIAGELKVNLIGTALCSIQALRVFVNRGKSGCIISNTSVHETIPKPGFLPYSMAKAAQGNLTRTLALEYAEKGIRVNAVGPGVVRTAMNAALKNRSVREETKEHIPSGRIIDAESIAKAFVFLASDDASDITGQTLMVDGGLTLYPDFERNWSSR